VSPSVLQPASTEYRISNIQCFATAERCSKDVRVLIVSSSDSTKEGEAVQALGFSGYFRKPSAYTKFLKLGPLVKDLLATSKGTGSE
jgi:hypothetical protein